MDPKSYADCAALASGRTRKLANNTYLETAGAPERYAVRLHSANVVTFYRDGRIALDSGGWRTVTTKDRMTRFSPFAVWSERGVWYVGRRSAYTAEPRPWVFVDGITFSPDGSVTGAGDREDTVTLRKQARSFAAGYIEALFCGEVPAPSNGDCWGCLMVAEDGSAPLGGSGHILEHFRENYYVPSMLARAVRNPSASASAGGKAPARGGSWVNGGDYVVSSAALHVLGFLWKHHDQPAPMWEGLAREQLRKALAKHLYRELGV